MARTLPWGRFTKSGDAELTEALRQAGTIGAFGNKGVFGNILDRLFFEAHGVEHVLGSAAQVAADYAMITWNQAAQRFEDKAGGEVVLQDYDRVAVIGMDTLTDDLFIDDVIGLEIFHVGNTPGQSGDNPKFKLGDKGGGEPYKIWLGSNTKDCKLDLMTDVDFRSLLNFTYSSTSTDTLKARFIANQGINNYIRVNGKEIYNPSRAGEIILVDTLPDNPYLIAMNGQVLPWAVDGIIAAEAWFRDLNVYLGGYRSNGTSFDETQGRFTLPALIAAAPYLFQVNTANRFMTNISAVDARVHSRTDSNGVSIAATGTFASASNVVTFGAGIGNIKNGMRINGASARGIVDGVAGTTILRNINTATNTAEMYNALTGAAVNASSSGNTAVTLNNSGAAGGSHDVDYFQGHRFYNGVNDNSPDHLWVYGGTTDEAPGSALTAIFVEPITTPYYQGLTSAPKTDGVNGTPRTHSQTQPRSSGTYYYYRA